MTEKLKALLENEDFCKKLAECKAAEEVKALLAANGVELSAEQVSKLPAAAKGELSEEQLKDVAGGDWLTTMLHVGRDALAVLQAL